MIEELKIRKKFFKMYMRRLIAKPYPQRDLQEQELAKYSRDEIYEHFKKDFALNAPFKILKHRLFFNQNRRGFGEDAFHSMWLWIFRHFSPKRCLEIGVYRGQVISLWQLLSDELSLDCEIEAISPFTSAGDEVSNYLEIDYYQDVLDNFDHLKLKHPVLHKGLSTDANLQTVIKDGTWDLIYIDGSHDEEVVRNDMENAFQNIRKGGLVVMDDSSLFFDFSPKENSFAGHPGPSLIAKEYEPYLLFGVGHNNIFIKN